MIFWAKVANTNLKSTEIRCDARGYSQSSVTLTLVIPHQRSISLCKSGSLPRSLSQGPDSNDEQAFT